MAGLRKPDCAIESLQSQYLRNSFRQNTKPDMTRQCGLCGGDVTATKIGYESGERGLEIKQTPKDCCKKGHHSERIEIAEIITIS